MSNMSLAIAETMSVVFDLALISNKRLNFIPHDLNALKQHVYQIVFELIKDTYIEQAKEDAASLYRHSGGAGCEEELKRLSRTMNFANYYRNDLSKEFAEKIGHVPPELEIIDMSSSQNKHKGYQISQYDLDIINAINKLKLLKWLTDRRITSVKKLLNSELDDEYEFYRNYFFTLYRSIKNDSEYIRYSILLFTTELKYGIETVYRLATKLSEHNTCKSNNKFGDDFMKLIPIFSAPVYYECNNTKFIKENSLLLMKIDHINALQPDNLDDAAQKYTDNLLFACFAKRLVLQSTKAKDYIYSASNFEKRQFIKEHYNIWSILNTQLTWGHKKEKYLRDIYSHILKSIEPPKIK